MNTYRIDYKYQKKNTPTKFYFDYNYDFVKSSSLKEAKREFLKDFTKSCKVVILAVEKCMNNR